MSGPGSGTGFPTIVNAYLPPAVLGDFAGANIRASVIGGGGGYAASPGGVSVGVMGWFNPTTGIASTYFQTGAAAGFVHRDQQALVTNFLGVSSLGIVGGDMVTGMAQGDFWGLFTAGATVGQKVYANPTTGALTSNTTGNSVTATGTAGTVSANVLTVTAGTGTIAIGQIAVGGTLPPGTYIASGTGPWTLANLDGAPIPNNATSSAYTFYGVQETQFYVAEPVVANTTFTASLAVPASGLAFGVLTVTAVASGTLVPGQWLSATGLPGSANTLLLEQLTSTASGGALGSTGTYLTTNVYYTIASTNTFVATQGQVGRISSWANTY